MFTPPWFGNSMLFAKELLIVSSVGQIIVFIVCSALFLGPCALHAEEAPRLQMSLQQARATAIEHNLSLLLARTTQATGELADDRAMDTFVPVLLIDGQWSDDVSLVVDGERDRSLRYGAQVNWSRPQGTSMFARLNAVEFFSGQSFLPVPSNSLQLGISQSLLQGFGEDANLLGVADAEVALQRMVFVGEVNEFLLEVEQTYWALVFAQNDVKIKQRSYERARSQFDDTSENIKRGLLAPGEIFIVEENLVFFEQQLIGSKESLALAQNRLAQLTRRAPRTIIEATDDLAQRSFDPPPDYEQALGVALEKNPGVQAAKLRSTQREEQLAFEQNRFKPTLDLSAAATLNGIDPSRSQAWQQVFTARNPGWQVGVDFSIPLDRAPDRAEVEAAEIQKKRAEIAEEAARDQVRYGLQEALTRWTRRLEILALAEKRMDLALEKLKNEQDKYKSGLSTLANVVLFQRDLDSARLNVQSARQDVVLAAARVYQLQGTLVERAGVEVK